MLLIILGDELPMAGDDQSDSLMLQELQVTRSPAASQIDAWNLKPCNTNCPQSRNHRKTLQLISTQHHWCVIQIRAIPVNISNKKPTCRVLDHTACSKL